MSGNIHNSYVSVNPIDSTPKDSTSIGKKTFGGHLKTVVQKITAFVIEIFKSIKDFFTFKKSGKSLALVIQNQPPAARPVIRSVVALSLMPFYPIGTFDQSDIALLEETNRNLSSINLELELAIKRDLQLATIAKELEFENSRVQTPDTAGSNPEEALDDWESDLDMVHINIDKDSTEILQTFQDLQFDGSLDYHKHLQVALNSAGLKDDDILSFDRNSIIVRADLPSPDQIQRDFKVFKGLLKATYGEELANTVMKRYGLKNDTFNQPLTLKLFKSMLIGIAANYTINDLRELFRLLKRDQANNYMICGNRLNVDQMKEISSVNSFADLSAVQLNLLTLCFTKLSQTSDKLVVDEFFPNEGFYSSTGSFTNFNHDIKILRQNMITIPNDITNIDLFMSDYIAKFTAYLELKIGMVIKVQDANGKSVKFFKVCNKLNNYEKNWLLGDSVFTHILSPIETCQESIQAIANNQSPEEIYVVPRGITREINLQGGFLQCVPRVLDSSGVGKTDFEVRKHEILRLILDTLKFTKSNNIRLILTGHSMGGADTHRILAELIKILSSQDRPQFVNSKKIKIDVITHNPPYHEKTLDDSFTNDFANFDKIEKMRPQAERISVDHTIVYYQGDPVQEYTPGVYLGGHVKSDLYHPKVIYKSPKIGEKPSWGARHTMKGFGIDRHVFDEKVYTNETPNELKKVFHGSHAWTPPETWGESFAKNVGWSASTVASMVTYPAWLTAYYSTLVSIPGWRKILEQKKQ